MQTKQNPIPGKTWSFASLKRSFFGIQKSFTGKQAFVAGNISLPLTRLLPKLHGYSPNQREYQIGPNACQNIYIFNSSSFTCYTTVFIANSPAPCRTIVFPVMEKAGKPVSLVTKLPICEACHTHLLCNLYFKLRRSR
ncbi:hypothetical protein [Niastella sp. OAS944]|uniref:hypothetical protein n=1 Tax=Niastella sp. OAS944 TaxID=2664089 RepID=UPI003480C15F|nr:hypothetical protein [Chitinophagaceae bacterium OAS944]